MLTISLLSWRRQLKKNNVKTWSMSALHLYEQCPLKYYHEKVAKSGTKTSSPALERGLAIHAKAEHYLLGDITGIPKELQKFGKEFATLRKHKAKAEEEWTLDKHWQPVPDGWTDPRTWLRAKGDARVDNWVCDFKGLPLHTLIPTPTGWTTMGMLQVGSKVLDGDGYPTVVLNKSEIKNLDIYTISFDDTTEISCDEEHLWVLTDGSVKCVTELKPKDEIPIAKPLQLPEADLPIAPYLLGHWLGDGRENRSEITSNKSDVDEILSYLTIFGEKVNHVYGDKRGSNVACYSPVGLKKRLGRLGVIGNKHIPPWYLRSSLEQRIELMRGLMDSDGTSNTCRQQAVFCNTNEQLIDDVYELACTLGQRPLKSSYTYHGFGKTGTAFRVSFRPQHFNPFLLKRKASVTKWEEWGPGKSHRRKIKKIEKVQSEPSQCIEVSSPTSTFLCGSQFCVTHNTGKRYDDKHEDQARLYSNIVMMYEPSYQVVDVEFWYVDSGDVASYSFNRSDLDADIEHWEARTSRLFKEKNWLPKENPFCRWCQFQKDCDLFK